MAALLDLAAVLPEAEEEAAVVVAVPEAEGAVGTEELAGAVDGVATGPVVVVVVSIGVVVEMEALVEPVVPEDSGVVSEVEADVLCRVVSKTLVDSF
jgi:hypothetical protein